METEEDIKSRKAIEEQIKKEQQQRFDDLGTLVETEKKPLTSREKWLMNVFGTLTPNRHQRRSYEAKQRHQKKVSKQ